MIQLTPVENSSQIKAFGYDAATGVMSILFHRGTHRYDYPNVSPEDAAAFQAAESKGKAFGSMFRGREFEKVDVSAGDEQQAEAAEA